MSPFPPSMKTYSVDGPWHPMRNAARVWAGAQTDHDTQANHEADMAFEAALLGCQCMNENDCVLAIAVTPSAVIVTFESGLELRIPQ